MKKYIEMKRLDGIETAKRIRAKNKLAVIIFVTSHSDFVFQGYEVGALNYIMKPYNSEKIREVLNIARKDINLIVERYYLIETRGKTLRLPLSQIKYFFSDKRSISAVTTESTHVFYGKLSEVEQEVPPHFVRIHNRYLINIQYLQSIEGNSVVLDTELLPVSRTFKQQLSRWIHLKARSNNGYFSYEITNSKGNAIRYKQKKIMTDKDDKTGHGIGLKNVSEIITKHHGHLDISHTDEKFSLTALI